MEKGENTAWKLNAVLRPRLCSRGYSKTQRIQWDKESHKGKRHSFPDTRNSRTYSRAHEAGLELKTPGFSVVVPALREEDDSAATRLKELLEWQRQEKSQKEG